MNDFQKTPSDAGLGVLLTNRRTWAGASLHVGNNQQLLAYLIPATKEHHAGYWFIAVCEVKTGMVNTSPRPVSPLGVELILSTFGVDTSFVNWQPCDDYPPSAENPFNKSEAVK